MALVVVADSKNKSALAAIASCFELLSHSPVTKTVVSPITPALIQQTMAGAKEKVGFVLSEAGLELTAQALTASRARFDVGEAAILAIDEEAWEAALDREAEWKWVGTITPSEGR